MFHGEKVSFWSKLSYILPNNDPVTRQYVKIYSKWRLTVVAYRLENIMSYQFDLQCITGGSCQY